MVTVTEDFSILSNFKKERETKVDSFFTDSDQNAFDSANMHFESLRFANAVVHNTAKKVGVTKKELQYYNSKPISVNVFNAAGVDIFPNISASVKKEIEERNKKMFDAMLNQ